VPSFAQLLHCQPQAFIEAGQTYQRMAQGFGTVQQAFSRAAAVLSGDVWSGLARDQAIRRALHLDGGLRAGGEETNGTGRVLVTLGQALTAAQTSLRTAIATARGVGLVVTPTGQVFNPNPVYNHAGNAMLGPTRAAIAAAVAAATAADSAAAGKIAVLAGGKLISTFSAEAGQVVGAVQQVAAVATAPDTGGGSTSAEAIAQRRATVVDLGPLGRVDRSDIDRVVGAAGALGSSGVLGPTGVIGAAGLAAWTARRRRELGEEEPDPS
jgi:hypothetical protein